jgi:hypothetical protein
MQRTVQLLQRPVCRWVKEVIATFSKNHTKHIKYVVWQNVEFCTAVAYNACGYLRALKG